MENPPSQRRGNIQRAEWRKKCREKLSDHLKEKLDIVVDPEQVRLIPDVEDGYMWDPEPRRQHLFTRQISKHSTGAYMELCEAVGSSIKAVKSPGKVGGGKQDDLATKISALEIELLQCKEHAQANSIARQRAEEKLEQSQANVAVIQTKVDQLQRENGQLSSRYRLLRKKMGRYDRHIQRAFSVLQKLGSNSGDGSEQRR